MYICTNGYDANGQHRPMFGNGICARYRFQLTSIIHKQQQRQRELRPATRVSTTTTTTTATFSTMVTTMLMPAVMAVVLLLNGMGGVRAAASEKIPLGKRTKHMHINTQAHIKRKCFQTPFEYRCARKRQSISRECLFV